MTPTLAIDALVPDDVPELMRLARVNGHPAWGIAKGAHGTVVRDGAAIAGFCFIRETPHGFVVDELWCDHTRVGIASLGMLADWIESTVQRIANERGKRISLGGVVRLDNHAHKAALLKRGYETVATVLAKDFRPL